MSAQLQVQGSADWPTRRRAVAGLLGTAGTLLASCSQTSQYLSSTPAQSPQTPLAASIGAGQVKAGLILPLSAAGNAGVAGQAMRNAAEMAIAEFNNPNIQLLSKTTAAPPKPRALARNRRSMKARRSFSDRYSRNRSASSARWRMRATSR